MWNKIRRGTTNGKKLTTKVTLTKYADIIEEIIKKIE